MTRRDQAIAGVLVFAGLVAIGWGVEVMWHGAAFVFAGLIVLAIGLGVIREGGV